MTPEQKKLNQQFKHFRKRYFKGRESYTGQENAKCILAFRKKKGIVLN